MCKETVYILGVNYEYSRGAPQDEIGTRREQKKSGISMSL
jgi:hypothetical protein